MKQTSHVIWMITHLLLCVIVFTMLLKLLNMIQWNFSNRLLIIKWKQIRTNVTYFLMSTNENSNITIAHLTKMLVYKTIFHFKIYKKQFSKYLFDIISQSNCRYRTRYAHNIPHNNVKHQFFKNSYLQSPVVEWNKLDSNIQNLETINIFKSKILKFIRPTATRIQTQFSRYI